MKSIKVIISLSFLLFSYVLYSQTGFYDIDAVQDIRIRFKEGNWDHILDSLFLNYGEDARMKADVSINGITYKDAGIRYKGFSSWYVDEAKAPFNIDLDYSVDNRNYQGFTKIKLGNVIHDPSFIRETLAYKIIGRYMPVSRANYAEVYVNDTLLGLYTNVEAVDKRFIKDRFGSDKNSFFKGAPEDLEYPFGQNSNLAYTHGTDSAGYMPYYKAESLYGWENLLKFIYILNQQTDSMEFYLNVDRTIWMHAINYSILNLDSYIGYAQNYYLYLDDHSRFNPIIWDLNMSFGSFRNSDATALNLTIPKVKQINPLQHLYSATFSPRPLTKNIFQNDTYRKMYLAHMRTIINENFRNGEYLALGMQMQNLIAPYVLNDTNRFYPYDDFINNLTVETGSSADKYPGIKDLMDARIAYLDTFPGFHGEPVIENVKHDPETPFHGGQISVTARIYGVTSATLAYRFSSTEIFVKTALYDDGLHQDGLAGDTLFGAILPVNGAIIQYYIYAENDSAGAFSPERAEYEFYTVYPQLKQGNLVINEIMAERSEYNDGIGDPGGWIELFNNSGEAIWLNNVAISNGKVIWYLPDTVMPAKTFIVIFTGGDTVLTGLFAPALLSSIGGDLFIKNSSGKIMDSLKYGNQAPEKSTGRYPNGVGYFTFMEPSPGKNNFIGTTKTNDFNLFPNPASGMVGIEIKNENRPLRIEVISFAGQIEKAYQVDVSGELVPVVYQEINVSGLRQGLYFVRVICNDSMMIKKLIIN